MFVLLAGPEGTELTKPEERPHWGYGKVRHGVRDWAEENGLAVVGEWLCMALALRMMTADPKFRGQLLLFEEQEAVMGDMASLCKGGHGWSD